MKILVGGKRGKDRRGGRGKKIEGRERGGGKTSGKRWEKIFGGGGEGKDLRRGKVANDLSG